MAEQFVGRWVMQGLSWPLRKVICLAGFRMDVSVTPREPNSAKSTDPREQIITVNLTLTGTPTGGLGGSTEVRKMDWSILERNDFLFGLCQEQSHFVYPKEGGDEHESTEKGKAVYPDVEMQTKVDDLRAGRFLRGEINEDGSESLWDLAGRKEGVEEEKGGKQDGPVWVHTFVRNLRGNGWTAEQIWGFEVINGERCHTRRIVVANTKGQYVLARLVYKYVGEETGSQK
ncbi:hypothetical protein BDW60DRAFT_213988 [Aspergillus nidulans var. acristatus]